MRKDHAKIHRLQRRNVYRRRWIYRFVFLSQDNPELIKDLNKKKYKNSFRNAVPMGKYWLLSVEITYEKIFFWPKMKCYGIVLIHEWKVYNLSICVESYTGNGYIVSFRLHSSRRLFQWKDSKNVINFLFHITFFYCDQKVDIWLIIFFIFIQLFLFIFVFQFVFDFLLFHPCATSRRI